MDKIIHICFSQSTAGSMKHAMSEKLLEGSKVISLFDDLSSGPIVDITHEKRAIWWNKLIPKDEFEYIEEFKQNYEEFSKQISKIKDETIYIWYGENAYEFCGLLYAMSHLENKINNIYTINVSRVIYNSPYNLRERNEYKPRGTMELAPERLIDFIKVKEKMNESIFNSMKMQWNKLKEENALFRICENEKVISVSEEYLDEFILGYTEEKFIKCARVVGNALGYSKVFVGDTFIFWRILEMIKMGKIEYKGKLGIMREMEIRQSDEIYIRNYNKLVRDNIPEIIKKAGKEVTAIKLSDDEYLEALNEKIQEEATEYFLDNNIEELADIVEVVYAILEYRDVSIEEFEKIRLKKKNVNGGFKERLFLTKVKKL